MRQLLLLMVCAFSLMGCGGVVSGNAILTGATYEPKHTVAFTLAYTASFARTISLADATEIVRQSAMNECGSSHVTLLEHHTTRNAADVGYYHFLFECGS